MNRKLAAIFCLIGIVLTGMLGVVRWRSANMHRPLEYDEFLTVEYYTLAGLKSSGEALPLRRESMLATLPPPGLRQIAMGLYRSWAVWREPNNHVVNSLLIDLTLLRGGGGAASEAKVRLPALLGALLFAWLAMAFCASVSGGWMAAPLVAVWAFCTPYVVDYSQSARGYTWMLALQVLLILLEYSAAQKPASRIRLILCATVALLSIVNMVNLAVDWIFPFFLALYFCPPLGMAADEPKRLEWRRNVFMQALAVVVGTAVFFMDRFAYLASSAGQYGEATRIAELPRRAVEMFQYLFPGMIWPIVGIAGIVGLVLMWKSPRHRFMAVLAALVAVVSFLHFAAAGTTPYLRGIGYFLPLFLIGAGFALQQLLQPKTHRMVVATAAAAALAVTITTTVPTFAQHTIDDRAATAYRPLVVASAGETSGLVHAVLPPIKDYIIRKELPANWQDDQDPLVPNQDVTLAFFVRRNGSWGIDEQNGVAAHLFWRAIPHLEGLSGDGTFAIAQFPAHVISLDASTSAGDDAIFLVWYPDATRLGPSGGELMDYLGRSGVAYIRRDTRVPTKVDFYGRLLDLEFVPENTDDCRKIIEVIRSGLERFGGNAVLAVRHAPATAPAVQDEGSRK